ncbi:MAG: integrase family protein [Polaromonas sp.]|nr:integrase family protein [Polaromonas sp.]
MKRQINRVRLTAGRVDAFTCPADKPQAFLWDTDTPTLALRATPTGRKTYVFESRLNGSTIRINIGTLAATIEQARTKAKELAVMVDAGTDPREVERDRQAAAVEKKAAAAAKVEAAKVAAVTVGEAWADYMAERRPHWGERHYSDHLEKAAPGGVLGLRGKVTRQGPLLPLMALPLHELDAPTIEAWAAREALTRATSARLAWRLLKAFLGWCNEQSAYAGLLSGNPAKTKKSREALGKPAVKTDVLQREQLPVWFEAVHNIHNPVVAAALQVMLLTGARPGEVLALRWADVNIKWKGFLIRDKVEGTREIPATPYLLHLLAALPRRNAWVFAGMRSEVIANPTELHARACAVAGIDGLTLHGLRRSFKSLTEWLEIPAGVVAQLMGHKPSATAEKHYTVRPLDLLRVHHEKIEAWILEQAGIVFDTNAAPGALRVVAA